MRVAVVGSGGREHAIAWACRRHGHDVRLVADLAGRRAIAGPRDPRAGGGAGRRGRRPLRGAGRPVLRPDRCARPAGVLQGVRPRARRCRSASPGPRFARFAARDHRAAVEWAEQLGRPVVDQARRPGRGQGGHRPGVAERDVRRDRRHHRAVRPRGADARPGVLAARPVRRPGRPGAAPGAGPQAHRRGRHRAEHRWDGRLCPRTGSVHARRVGGDVRPADPRPLRRRRHRRTSACSTPG